MKIQKTLICIVFASIFLAGPAYAASTNGNANSNGSRMAAAKCAAVEQRLQVRSQAALSGKTGFLNAYLNLKNRLEAFNTKLTARGYDTAKLREDNTVLTDKINKFSTDYANYVALLQQTHTYACGRSNGEFLAKLQETRTALWLAHQDSKDIRAYYHDVIRVDLQAIKKQTPSIKQSNSNANLNANANTNAVNSNN